MDRKEEGERENIKGVSDIQPFMPCWHERKREGGQRNEGGRKKEAEIVPLSSTFVTLMEVGFILRVIRGSN